MEPSEYYNTLLELVRNLLDGNIEGGAFEDQLREMFGIHAYMAFTLDKVVTNTVRQVCNIQTQSDRYVTYKHRQTCM